MTVAITVAVDADADAVEKLFNDELGRAVAELRRAARRQAGRPADRYHRRRPGLALHPRRRRTWRRRSWPATRCASACSRASAASGLLSRSKKRSSCYPKRTPLRAPEVVFPRPGVAQRARAGNSRKDSLTKGIGRASLLHSSRPFGVRRLRRTRNQRPRLGRRMMTLRNPLSRASRAPHRRCRDCLSLDSSAQADDRPRHRQDARRVPIDAPLPRLLAAR